MKFFIDTADINHIKETTPMGIIDGVTTIPSLVAKVGRSFREILIEICDTVHGPVSAEVVSLNADEMMKEARELAGLPKTTVLRPKCWLPPLGSIHSPIAAWQNS